MARCPSEGTTLSTLCECVCAGQTATAAVAVEEKKCFEARSQQQQLCCCFRLRKCRAARARKERERRSAVRAKPLRTTRRATTRLPDLSLSLYRSFARAWSHSLAAAVVVVVAAAKCSDLVYSCTAFIQALSSRSWPGRGSGGDHVVDEFWQCRRGSSAAAAAADSNRMQWW